MISKSANTLVSDAVPPKRATFGGRMTCNRRFQHGSLFKRGTRTKVWVARWWEEVIGPDNNPERIRRSEILGTVSEIPTKKQAEQLLADLLRPVNSGERRPQAILTFKNFIEDRWKPEIYPTLKFSSKKFYDNMLKTHLIPAFGETQLRLITRDAVQSFLFGKTRSGLSWKTVKHIRTAFGTMIESAVMQDLIPANPVRKTRLPRRGPVQEKSPIAPETVHLLIEKLAEPSRSIAILLAMTGLRIGELLALRWQDIDLQNGFLAVRQTVYEGHFDEPKSRRSKRSVPLSPICIEILTARKPDSPAPADLVFSARNGSPLCRRNLLNRQLKPTCKALGVKGANWHWLRHANATLLDAVGTPLGTVQALLGHSSSQITRETYIHSVPADARRAVNEVEKLIGPKWTQVPEMPKQVSGLIH
jgi:integrase